MKISVAGTGYVGLVTAVCLAEKGHLVTCFDIDKNKIEYMTEGKAPIFEQGLEELMIKNKDRIKYTSDHDEAYRHPDVIVIGVGTPEKKDGSANLQYVYDVSRQLAQTIENDCTVIVKSTVPVGTSDKVEQLIRDNLKHHVNIEVVSNPEFLSQGTAIKDTLNASRIVLGVETPRALEVMKQMYSEFNIPYVITNRNSAEMIKYAANDFLALKISYINEIANLCELVGANVEDVARGMGMDPRIGGRFLNAGIGYGGSCFPKDTKALHWLAKFNDCELKTIKAAIEVNENQKLRLITKARKYFDSFHNINIAVLGLTFKPGTDDLREAPSLDNIPVFLEEGAKVKVWDPIGANNFRRKFPSEIMYCESIEETIKDAEVCFIFTEWPEIRQFDIDKYGKLMKNPLVIDGRNCYALELAGEARIVYESIGRKTISNYKNAYSVVTSK